MILSVLFFEKMFCVVKWDKTNAFSSIGKVKAYKTAKSFPTYRILVFSKFDRLDHIISDFFNKFLKTWSWTSWQKKSVDLDLEDRIWRLEFGKTQFSCFEAAIWRMNFKACTFERLALIFGFGRGAQVVKTSPFWKWIYTAQASTLGVFIFYFGTLQALGSHQNPRYWKKT